MAQLIPDVSPDELSHDSERLVLAALTSLPRGYVVMHSYPWLRPDRDRPDGVLREGEADFIVLHPQRGMLVVEVKGGDCSLENRVWTRAGKAIRDPFEQARRSKYALLDAVKLRTRGAVTKDTLTHGELIIFPHHTYRGALPLNADPRSVIDATGLADIEARVLAAFESRLGPGGPPPALFEKLKAALLPSLRLVRCTTADISAEAARLVQLTLDQHAVLSGLLESRRVLVQGVAGSGKTLLALEYATTLAERGKRVLFLCYNRHLAEWARERLANERRLDGTTGVVEVDNFHRYALRLAADAGVEFDVPRTNADHFWEHDAAVILEQALDYLRGTPAAPVFDAVVVDEGQDFSKDWWVTVDQLAGGARGSLYVFLDVDQALRPSACAPPELPARFSLTVNCRNTRQITRSGAAIASVRVTTPAAAPEGEPPALRGPATTPEVVRAVVAEVRTLLQSGVRPVQIAIIGPAALENGSIRGTSGFDHVPVITDAAAWRRGDGVLVSTARAFKGLEADVVVLYDLSSFGDLFTVTDLYVAWTRAKHRLIVICQPGPVRAAIEAALAVGPS